MSARSPDRAGSALRVSVLLVLSLTACSKGEVLALGGSEPLPYRFGPPRLVPNLDVAQKLDNPTLTGDLLEIYFTAGVAETDTDVWTARRARRDVPFEDPELVSAVNSSAFETSSAISSDGLSLWVGSNRAGSVGNLDIWLSTRASRSASWSAPRSVRALSSDAMDIPRPPGQNGLVMPLSSDRRTPGFYQTFLARRGDSAATFEAPAWVDTLSFEDSATVDAFLTDDGLTLFFSSNTPPEPLDLFVAWRKTTSDPFASYAPLAGLNTPDGDERDPWLSPDGSELYFASDATGSHRIYVASVRRDVDLARAGN